MAVIGIDLGTTYSAAARVVDGVPEIIDLDGAPTLPSVVGVQANGKIVVGRIAKRNQAKNPQDTIVEVKRMMGQNVGVSLGQKKFKPQEISAMILAKIKEFAEADLGEEITGAVISCPAYFKDPERHATKEAGELAGLNVLRIVNEPTAAAYAYGLMGKDENKENLFLVYDLGGGTFDVTVIKMIGGSLEVIGTGGDPQLGGGNFDDRIVDWILEHLEKIPGYAATLTDEKRRALRLRLKAEAEDAKKALCGPPSQEVYQFQIAQVSTHDGRPIPFREELTLDTFEELITDLMENSLQWVDEALKVPKEKHYTEDHLTEILLVGGSTRVPLVRRILERRFPNTPIRGLESGINPDEIVARGASIIAAETDPESDEVSDTILVDVTGHTLSVAAFDPQKNRELLQAIIPKETQIPTSARYTFGSAGNFQPQCKIRVYQGEGEEINPEKVTLIGEFFVDIEPVQDPIPLHIGLDLDENGILIAHATDGITGKQVKCQINYDDSAQMSPEELKQKQALLEQQMNAVVGTTVNPLDEATLTAQQSSGSWGQPASQPRQPMPRPSQPIPQPTQPAVSNPGDPTAMMNPMMRTLYNKAINSYDRLSPDRQNQVMQMVIEIQNAAQSGDQNKLMSYLAPLSQLLQGID